MGKPPSSEICAFDGNTKARSSVIFGRDLPASGSGRASGRSAIPAPTGFTPPPKNDGDPRDGRDRPRRTRGQRTRRQRAAPTRPTVPATTRVRRGAVRNTAARPARCAGRPAGVARRRAGSADGLVPDLTGRSETVAGQRLAAGLALRVRLQAGQDRPDLIESDDRLPGDTLVAGGAQRVAVGEVVGRRIEDAVSLRERHHAGNGVVLFERRGAVAGDEQASLHGG